MDCANDSYSAKCWLRWLKRENASIRVFSTVIDQKILRECLLLHGNYTEADLGRLFHLDDDDDDQNLSDVVSMCKCVAELENFTLGDVTQHTLRSVLPGVKIIAFICRCFSVLLTCNTNSLSSHLENLSALAHVLLVLHRINGTDFLPSLTYSSIISFVRSHYNSCAAASELGCRQYYYFQDNFDRGEAFFRILRSLMAAEADFDIMQLTERLNSVQDLQALFMRRPELDQAQVASNDIWNSTTWIGESRPDGVNFRLRWDAGRERASQLLRRCGASDKDIDWDSMKSQGVTITMPTGTPLAANSGSTPLDGCGPDAARVAAHAAGSADSEESSSIGILMREDVDPNDLFDIEMQAEERGVVTLRDEPTPEDLEKRYTWGEEEGEPDARAVSTYSEFFIIIGKEFPKWAYIKRAFA